MPGGHGKVPIGPGFIEAIETGDGVTTYTIRDARGCRHCYADPQPARSVEVQSDHTRRDNPATGRGRDCGPEAVRRASKMTDGITRKSQHLDIVLRRDVGARGVTTGFEAIRFEHVALPEMALGDVDLSTTFLNRRLGAPLLVSSMTGGPERADGINRAIAEAAQHFASRSASARSGWRSKATRPALARGGFGRHLRDAAPDVPILANFGAAQLAEWDGADMARRAVDMIGADALIVHLNPLQEVVQPEGDRDWRGLSASSRRCSAARPCR